jgi:hypothetical protein
VCHVMISFSWFGRDSASASKSRKRAEPGLMDKN